MKTRLAIFAEQLEIIHRQWTEDLFSFAGTYYTLEDCRALPRPVQWPRPPLIVGGRATAGTVGPAVRFADEYNTFSTTPTSCASDGPASSPGARRAGEEPVAIPRR